MSDLLSLSPAKADGTLMKDYYLNTHYTFSINFISCYLLQ